MQTSHLTGFITKQRKKLRIAGSCIVNLFSLYPFFSYMNGPITLPPTLYRGVSMISKRWYFTNEFLSAHHSSMTGIIISCCLIVHHQRFTRVRTATSKNLLKKLVKNFHSKSPTPNGLITRLVTFSVLLHGTSTRTNATT